MYNKYMGSALSAHLRTYVRSMDYKVNIDCIDRLYLYKKCTGQQTYYWSILSVRCFVPQPTTLDRVL